MLLAILLSLPVPSVTGPDTSVRAAAQAKRVALVVGNSAYRYTPGLANPKNDAADMSAVLRKLGWHVIEGFDLDKAAFDRTIREFSAALQGAEAGLFYYAGHGLQVAGSNYLVPIDAQLTAASSLDFEMVGLDVVRRAMEGAAQTSILVIDACRDNPLSRNLARAMGTRSAEIGQGLAAVEGGIGLLISFSTQPGNVALDGKGRNSPFTGALVRHLAASRDDLSAVLIAARNDVVKATGRRQVPWEHSALTARFYFNSAAHTSAPVAGAQLVLSEAGEVWGATKDVSSIPLLEAFARRYSETFYAELARDRLELLRKREVAQW